MQGGQVGRRGGVRDLLLKAGTADAAASELIGRMIEEVDNLKIEQDGPPDPRRPQAESALGNLHGLEGAGSAAFFGGFGQLLKQELGFGGRHRRPPTDPVNALLSFGYVLLMNHVLSALQIAGFDPYVGFLHSEGYGKPALALDMMEEMRTPIVDSVVLTVVNKQILQAQHFEATMGTYQLTGVGRKLFLQPFEQRLNLSDDLWAVAFHLRHAHRHIRLQLGSKRRQHQSRLVRTEMRHDQGDGLRMLALDEVGELLGADIADEVEWRNLQIRREPVNDFHRPRSPERLLQDVLGVFNAALCYVFLCQRKLVEFRDGGVTLDGRHLAQGGDLQCELLDLLILHMLENGRSGFRIQRNQDYRRLSPPAHR